MSIQTQSHKFAATILQNLPEIPEDIMQGWIENPKALRKFLASLCPSSNGSLKEVQQQIQEWSVFYKKHFGITLGEVQVPDYQEGFNRLIIVAKGLTLNQVYNACARQFPCWRYANDLDARVTKNDREAKDGTYVIWVRDRVEADEENKNLSADQLQKQQIPGTTLLERMLQELKYFDETGKHLDINSWTLCSGSRSSVGGVPGAGWGGVRFKVDWYYSDRRVGVLRSRSVVSLPAKQA